MLPVTRVPRVRRCRAITNAVLAWGAGQEAQPSDGAQQQQQLYDIAIDESGRIAAIEPAAAAGEEEATPASPATAFDDDDRELLDARGALVMPGLVDAHVHLDKALLNCRCCAATGCFQEAMTETLRAKRGFTVEDVEARACHVVEAAIGFGTTRMRSHAEVDPEVGLRSVEALLRVKRAYAWALDLEVAAFAQEEIRDGGKLLREALALGVDVVGSAPYCDRNPEANIRLIFELAREFGLRVDFHLDYHLGTDKPSLLDFVLDRTTEFGYQGKVCLGHCTALSSLPPEQLEAAASRLRNCDVSLLALPASDVYMMARGDACDRRRGVAPIHRLHELGVRTSFATNNVQNLFTFTGDGDLLKVATLTAQMLQLGSRKQHADLLRMASEGAAQVLKGSAVEADAAQRHGLVVGANADLIILLDAASATDALAAPSVRRTVLKRGRVVAATTAGVELFPSSEPKSDQDSKCAESSHVSSLECGLQNRKTEA